MIHVQNKLFDSDSEEDKNEDTGQLTKLSVCRQMVNVFLVKLKFAQCSSSSLVALSMPTIKLSWLNVPQSSQLTTSPKNFLFLESRWNWVRGHCRQNSFKKLSL